MSVQHVKGARHFTLHVPTTLFFSVLDVNFSQQRFYFERRTIPNLRVYSVPVVPPLNGRIPFGDLPPLNSGALHPNTRFLLLFFFKWFSLYFLGIASRSIAGPNLRACHTWTFSWIPSCTTFSLQALHVRHTEVRAIYVLIKYCFLGYHSHNIPDPHIHLLSVSVIYF